VDNGEKNDDSGIIGVWIVSAKVLFKVTRTSYGQPTVGTVLVIHQCWT